MYFKKILFTAPLALCFFKIHGEFYTKTLSVFKDASGKRFSYSKSYRIKDNKKPKISIRASSGSKKNNGKKISFSLREDKINLKQQQKLVGLFCETFFDKKTFNKHKKEAINAFLKTLHTSETSGQANLENHKTPEQPLLGRHARFPIVACMLPFPLSLLALIPSIDKELEHFEDLILESQDKKKTTLLLGGKTEEPKKKTPRKIIQKKIKHTKKSQKKTANKGKNIQDGEGGTIAFYPEGIQKSIFIPFFRGAFSLPQDDSMTVDQIKTLSNSLTYTPGYFVNPFGLTRAITHKGLVDYSCSYNDLTDQHQELKSLLKGFCRNVQEENHHDALKTALFNNLMNSKCYIKEFNPKHSIK